MSEYKKIENAKAELQCTLEGETWKKAIAKAFNKVAAKVEIKGFRKGQAPKNMIEKYINHNEVLIEAAESLAQATLEEAIKEHNVQLIDRPSLKVDELADEKCVITFECPVLPDVKLGDYKAIKYQLDEVKVEDIDVDDQIAKLLDQKADLELKEDGTVEDGDTAVIDYEGFLDGKAFDGGKGENYDLVIGSHAFIPGFEEQLIGMKAEEEKEIKVTFPADYHAEDLKGKETTFKVTVHEIKKKVLPVLDDEFVKEQKIENVNTVEELKNYTKENLIKQKKNAAEQKADNNLIDELVKLVDVEIPDVMISAEQDSLLRSYESNLMQQGISLDQFLKITKQTRDDIKANMKDQAIKRIKMNLGLSEIAKLDNIVVTDDDVEAEINKMADMYKMPVDDIKKVITADNLKDDLVLQKALDSLKK